MVCAYLDLVRLEVGFEFPIIDYYKKNNLLDLAIIPLRATEGMGDVIYWQLHIFRFHRQYA